MKNRSKKKISRRRWLLPIAAIILTVLVLQLLYSRKQVGFEDLQPENGVLHAENVDFSEKIYNVTNQWDYYPNHLYSSEDFKNGIAEQPMTDGRNVSAKRIPYGTYRLILKAEPRKYLSICSFSLDFGTKVFVDGTEVISFGRVADNPADAIPAGGYMTVPIYTGESGTVEIIYQYSNFVHTEGGTIPATCLSEPQNIDEYKEGTALVSLSLSGAMLFLTLYFLLSASILHQTGALALAFCCFLMVLRDNLYWGTFFFSPDVSWYFNYRISQAVAALLPMAVLFLFRSVYAVGKKSVLYIYCGIMAADVLLLFLMDTKLSIILCAAAYIVSLLYLIYMICRTIAFFREKKKHVRLEDLLVFIGLGVLVASIAAEAILTDNNLFATRFGMTPSGMMICVMLVALSVSLRVQAQKEALTESRNREEMLERMNALNMDYLHKVAHELKTPLTVISGYAQLAGLQIAENNLSSETPENLKIIQQEAMRLSDLVNNLMEYSHGRQSEVTFGTVEVGPLLDSVQAICTPMCLKNKNRVVIRGKECTAVYGNQEMLLQIFINLAVNANRHTENGTITISASESESHEYVVFRVQDTGCGISEEDQENLFREGFSGDGSSGIGLSVCRDAVEAHGGRIELEKTGPEGSTFAFTVLKRGIEK